MKLTSFGYKIPKALITLEEQVSIRTALTVKPVGIEDYKPLEEFPIYREDSVNLWVPKFFPIRNYINLEITGNSEKNGMDAIFKFEGILKPDQVTYVNTVMEYVNKYDAAVLCAQTGTGKCFAVDTEILMYNGTIKKIQDIQINDIIMGTNNEQRIVTSLTIGKSNLYKIRDINEYSINEPYIVNAGHILTLYDKLMKQVVDIEIEQVLNTNRYYGIREPVKFSGGKLPYDPQLYGKMLANTIIRIYNIMNKMEIIEEEEAEEEDEEGEEDEDEVILKVPNSYKTSSISNRIAFLQSFISTLMASTTIRNLFSILYQEPFSDQDFLSKFVTGKFYTDTSFIIKLAYKKDLTDLSYVCKDIRFIMQSLACKNYRDYSDLHYTTVNILPAYYSIMIENNGYGLYYGFTLKNADTSACNGRFILGSCIVAHNTTMSLKITEIVGKRALIIVHKEFLLEQWVERIKQFLPSTKVGRIQGPKVEIEDITIGLLQSISMRTYPVSTFKDFGLVIIDECHHIPSEVFSRALYKVSTKHILGLSATPIRKDGLTKVLNWFVGDILIKPALEGTFDTPVVQVIEFESDVEPKYDRYKGRLMLPDYITKLTKDPLRNEIITNSIISLLKVGRKIIVLTDRRDHCTLLKELILEKTVNMTVGLYLGGMNKDDLKQSEGCNVLLGTFSLCAEGFDLPTLDTLVLATPRSEITQIVGRILRKRNINGPYIVDIIDKLLYSSYKARYTHYKNNRYIVNREKKQKEETSTEVVFLD